VEIVLIPWMPFRKDSSTVEIMEGKVRGRCRTWIFANDTSTPDNSYLSLTTVAYECWTKTRRASIIRFESEFVQRLETERLCARKKKSSGMVHQLQMSRAKSLDKRVISTYIYIYISVPLWVHYSRLISYRVRGGRQRWSSPWFCSNLSVVSVTSSIAFPLSDFCPYASSMFRNKFIPPSPL